MKVATRVLALVAALATAVFLVLIMTGRVHAASFNCYAASKPAEFTICQTPTLGLLDELNAKVYYQIRDKLSPAARVRFNKNERYWIETRNLCANNADCILLAYTMHRKNLCDLAKALQYDIEECDGYEEDAQ